MVEQIGEQNARTGNRSGCSARVFRHCDDLPRDRVPEEVSLHARLHPQLEADGDLLAQGAPEEERTGDAQYRVARPKAVQRAGWVPTRHPAARLHGLRLLRYRPLRSAGSRRDFHLSGQGRLHVPVLRKCRPGHQPHHHVFRDGRSDSYTTRGIPTALVSTTRLLRLIRRGGAKQKIVPNSLWL